MRTPKAVRARWREARKMRRAARQIELAMYRHTRHGLDHRFPVYGTNGVGTDIYLGPQAPAHAVGILRAAADRLEASR